MATDQDIKRIAAEACVDPRTVRRVIEGKPTRSTVIARAIEAAATKLGIDLAAAIAAEKERASCK